MTKSKLLPVGVVVCLFAFTTGCASSDKTKGSAPAKETNGLAAAVLTQADAAKRAKELGDIHYKLWFGLDAERTEFDGLVEIKFSYTPQGEAEIPVDLEAGALRSVQLNGKELPAAEVASRFDGHRFKLKTAELAASNTIGIAYSHPYSKDGDGFYRFRDPVDGKVYLYTHFEPFFAHRLFPCFDQPDLKATYELAVVAPRDWQVISNTREISVQRGDGPRSGPFRSRRFSALICSRSTRALTRAGRRRRRFRARARSRPGFSRAPRSRSTSITRNGSRLRPRACVSTARLSATPTRSRSTTRSSFPTSIPARWRTSAR